MTLSKKLIIFLTRFPSTMLLRSAIRRECWEYLNWIHPLLPNRAIIWTALVLFFGALIALDYVIGRPGFYINTLIFGPLEFGLLAMMPFYFRPLRQKVLVPAHLRERLERARNRFSELAEEYNSRVSDSRYRLQALPKASPDDIDTVRRMLNERRLPEDLESGAESVIEAHREMAEAEAEYTAHIPTDAKTLTDPT